MKTTGPKHWHVRGYDETQARTLSQQTGLSTVAAGLLLARGFDTAATVAQLLNPSFAQLHDPALMLGMSDAVARVLRAIDEGEPILIYGDYDVDGTTGTVVLRRVLSLLGARTGFHVPHRFTEGYGIRQD